MVTQDFRNLLSAQPFRSFALVLSSGEKVAVRHPELAAVAGTTIHITEVKSNGRLASTASMYSLLHVTRIEFLDQESMQAEEAA